MRAPLHHLFGQEAVPILNLLSEDQKNDPRLRLAIDYAPDSNGLYLDEEHYNPSEFNIAVGLVGLENPDFPDYLDNFAYDFIQMITTVYAPNLTFQELVERFNDHEKTAMLISQNSVGPAAPEADIYIFPKQQGDPIRSNLSPDH